MCDFIMNITTWGAWGALGGLSCLVVVTYGASSIFRERQQWINLVRNRHYSVINSLVSKRKVSEDTEDIEKYDVDNDDY